VTTFGAFNLLIGVGFAILETVVLTSIPMHYLVRNPADGLGLFALAVASIAAMFSGAGILYRASWSRWVTLVAGILWSFFSLFFSFMLLMNEWNLLSVLGPFLVLYWFFCSLVVLNRVNRWEFVR